MTQAAPIEAAAATHASPLAFRPVPGRDWVRADLDARRAEIVRKAPDALNDEIAAMVARCRRQGLTLDTVETEDTLLPAFAAMVPAIRAELDEGSGVVVLAGIAVEELDDDAAGLVASALGPRRAAPAARASARPGGSSPVAPPGPARPRSALGAPRRGRRRCPPPPPASRAAPPPSSRPVLRAPAAAGGARPLRLRAAAAPAQSSPRGPALLPLLPRAGPSRRPAPPRVAGGAGPAPARPSSPSRPACSPSLARVLHRARGRAARRRPCRAVSAPEALAWFAALLARPALVWPLRLRPGALLLLPPSRRSPAASPPPPAGPPRRVLHGASGCAALPWARGPPRPFSPRSWPSQGRPCRAPPPRPPRPSRRPARPPRSAVALAPSLPLGSGPPRRRRRPAAPGRGGAPRPCRSRPPSRAAPLSAGGRRRLPGPRVAVPPAATSGAVAPRPRSSRPGSPFGVGSSPRPGPARARLHPPPRRPAPPSSRHPSGPSAGARRAPGPRGVLRSWVAGRLSPAVGVAAFLRPAGASAPSCRRARPASRRRPASPSAAPRLGGPAPRLRLPLGVRAWRLAGGRRPPPRLRRRRPVRPAPARRPACRAARHCRPR